MATVGFKGLMKLDSDSLVAKLHIGAGYVTLRCGTVGRCPERELSRGLYGGCFPHS